MKTSLLRLVVLFSLSMNLAVVAAFAYQHSRPLAEPNQQSATNPFAALALDAAQAEAFAHEKAGFATYRGNCHGEMSDMRSALVAELVAAEPDPEAITRTLAAMRERQSATERRLVEHLLALRAILRPEQQSSFARVMEKTLGGGCKRHGRECVHAIHNPR